MSNNDDFDFDTVFDAAFDDCVFVLVETDDGNLQALNTFDGNDEDIARVSTAFTQALARPRRFAIGTMPPEGGDLAFADTAVLDNLHDD